MTVQKHYGNTLLCQLTLARRSQSMSDSSSLMPRMYKTLLHLIKTSPKFPRKLPSTHSSVFNNCRFMYGSIDFNVPLYSIPHFSLVKTNLRVKSFKNCFGFTGTVA